MCHTCYGAVKDRFNTPEDRCSRVAIAASFGNGPESNP